MSEIRDIITDQINRHVAMSQSHRTWLADDIATRVEDEINRRIDTIVEQAYRLIWLIPTVKPEEQERLRLEAQNLLGQALAREDAPRVATDHLIALPQRYAIVEADEV